jgi:Cu/Ag efflux protein CusF
MNRRTWAGLGVALWVGTLNVGAQELTAGRAVDATSEKPAAVEAAVVSLTATVKAIDYTTRVVTLEKNDGTTVSMQVGPEAVRFNEVKKGDIVEIDYMVSVAMVVQSPEAGNATVDGSNVVVVRNEGKKPSGVAVATDVVSATVVKVNAKKRTATLKGSDGNTYDIDVAPDVENLKNVKKGDKVMVKLTRNLAIDVRKPGAKVK